MKQRKLIYWVMVAIALVLAALPAAARVRTIDSGSDFWMTPGDGSTFARFDDEPLPADFFCSGSAPFAGKIVLGGVPVVTSPQDKLGRADTVIQRLDQAVFDRKGVATTRIQVRAMKFEGVEHFVNECGTFKVTLDLEGEQPVTAMRIFRKGPDGGRFEAEIAVNVRIAFTPVGHKAEVVSIRRELRFPPYQGGVWAEKPGKGGIEHAGFVRIDTDSDGEGDTFVPGTSPGFAAGWPSKAEGVAVSKPASFEGVVPSAGETETAANTTPRMCAFNCHCDSDGVHCPAALLSE